VRTYEIVILTSACLIGCLRAEDAPDEEAARLVKALGSDSFEERNQAEKKLVELGLRAKSALEGAIKSDDAEVRLRAERVLPQLWDLDARQNEAAWIEKLGPGFGAAKLNAQIKAEEHKTEKEPTENEAKGAEHTENPVDCGLEWLAKAQNADGHWDSRKFGAQLDGDLAQTGWALLAFLGAGHTERVGQYKDNVRRAVAWLRNHQRADGAFCKKGEAVDGIAHAACGLAMAEAAGMGRIHDTIISAQLATDYSCNIHQKTTDEGKSGFGRARNSNNPELFTTTLFVMHLKSAKVAGLKVPADSFEGLIKFLDSLDDSDNHTFRLKPGGESSAKNNMLGIVSRQFLGWPREQLAPYAEAGVKGCGLPTTGTDTSDNFNSYIGNLAVFQQGGDLWKEWNTAMRKELTEKQSKSGDRRGSWAPGGVWAGAGRVLTTAWNTLDLEVYYRYKQLVPGE
jgi:hypothetical protein